MYSQNPYIANLVCRPAWQAGRQEWYKDNMYGAAPFILPYLQACMVFNRCGMSHVARSGAGRALRGSVVPLFTEKDYSPVSSILINISS